ncbi:MAG: hypothetical protein NT007_18600 [Candidatus Kapabacteria bacterium]|nr:hypothetical protein [Candidatus Kapabacteria bacterium]
MKNIFWIILIGIFSACSPSKKDEEKFLNTYREVLVIREKTLVPEIANVQVKKLLTDSGFTVEEFYKNFKYYSSNSEHFVSQLDSLRQHTIEQIKMLKKAIPDTSKSPVQK